jgi:hypothetical protein
VSDQGPGDERVDRLWRALSALGFDLVFGAPRELVMRARMVELSWSGVRVPAIAAELACSEKTVWRWLHRFNRSGLVGLEDLGGQGRKRRITEAAGNVGHQGQRGHFSMLAGTERKGGNDLCLVRRCGTGAGPTAADYELMPRSVLDDAGAGCNRAHVTCQGTRRGGDACPWYGSLLSSLSLDVPDTADGSCTHGVRPEVEAVEFHPPARLDAVPPRVAVPLHLHRVNADVTNPDAVLRAGIPAVGTAGEDLADLALGECCGGGAGLGLTRHRAGVPGSPRRIRRHDRHRQPGHNGQRSCRGSPSVLEFHRILSRRREARATSHNADSIPPVRKEHARISRAG